MGALPMKVALDPIAVPLVAEQGTYSSLLLGTQRLTAQGRFTLAQGSWELAGDAPMEVEVDEPSQASFECELQLRGEISENEEVQLWPTIDKLSIGLERALRWVQGGKPAVWAGTSCPTGLVHPPDRQLAYPSSEPIARRENPNPPHSYSARPPTRTPAGGPGGFSNPVR